MNLANDQPIRPGDDGTDAIGFTADKFSADSYLWRKGDAIWISLIFANHPGKGDFSRLVKNLEAAALKVIVPTPFAHMAAILTAWGYQPFQHPDGLEVWCRPSDKGTKS